MQNEKSAISLSCLPVFSHNITCAQVGNKCRLTSALIGQKSESELSPNLCGDVSVFIPNLGIILPAYYRRYKLASSVNLYRFTHFLDFPSGSIFVNCLLGKHPQSPLNATYGVGCAFILNTFTYWLLRNLHRSSIFHKRKNEHGRSCTWLFMVMCGNSLPDKLLGSLVGTPPTSNESGNARIQLHPKLGENFVPTWHKVKNVGNRKKKITST